MKEIVAKSALTFIIGAFIFLMSLILWDEYRLDGDFIERVYPPVAQLVFIVMYAGFLFIVWNFA